MSGAAAAGESSTPDNSADTGASAAVETAAGTLSTDANTAPSSDAGTDAKQAETQQSTLDIVRSVVAKGPEKSSGSDTAKPGSTDPAAASKPEGQGAAGDQDPPPFHEHPRWKAVLKERDQATEKATQLSVEVEQLRPAAAQMQRIDKFMVDNGLTSDDVVEGYRVMALIRNDPARAREALQALIDDIDAATGETLPADLQQKVEAGVLNEDDAREISRARAAANAATQRATETVQQVQAREQATAVANLRRAIDAEIGAWEAQIAPKDLDYVAVKKPFVLAEVTRIVTQERGGKPPASAQEARDIWVKAYDAVTEKLRGLKPAAPAPARQAPAPTRTANATAAAPEKARSTLDIVKQVASQRRR
jgi:hypothetical protein